MRCTVVAILLLLDVRALAQPVTRYPRLELSLPLILTGGRGLCPSVEELLAHLRYQPVKCHRTIHDAEVTILQRVDDDIDTYLQVRLASKDPAVSEGWVAASDLRD